MTGILLLASVFTILFVMYSNRKVFQPYRIFIIKKGKHYSISEDQVIKSGYKFQLAPKLLRFEAIFSEGCNYDSTLVEDDINKLYGINYGFDWHYRSVRIGWRNDSHNDVIELFAYSYVKGKRIFKHLSYVKQYEPIKISMNHNTKENQVEILVDREGRDKVYHIVKGIDKSWIRFKLFPYFGGNMTSPNDMKIIIKQY
jgi:hypothetical protein